MKKNNTVGITNSSVIDEIRSIYQRLGIPVNGLSKELQEILDL